MSVTPSSILSSRKETQALAVIAQYDLLRRNYRLNMSLAINAIPIEILCDIFMKASAGDAAVNISISQTCSYWRSVMLSYTLIWRCVDFETHPVKLAACLLSRSYNAPVSVCCNIYSDLPSEASTLCARHISHIQELKLGTWTADIDEWVIRKPAPKLRRFTLIVDDNFLSDGDDPHETVLSSLFGNCAPLLTDLTMIDARLPWTTSCFNHLRKLEIRCLSMSVVHPEDRDILQLLAGCPDLEELSLMRCEFPCGSRSSKSIPLRGLRRLTLELPPPLITHILAHIITSPSLDLHCDYSWSRLSFSQIDPCLPDNPQSLPVLDILHSMSVEIQSGRPSSFTISGCATPESEGSSVQLRSARRDSGLIFSNVIASITTHYPLLSLRTMEIIGKSCTVLDAQFVHNLLSLLLHTSTVTDLSLENLLYPEFWRALDEQLLASELRLLPSLQSLTITNTSIHQPLMTFLRHCAERLPSFRHIRFVACIYAEEDEGHFEDDRNWLNRAVKVEMISLNS